MGKEGDTFQEEALSYVSQKKRDCPFSSQHSYLLLYLLFVFTKAVSLFTTANHFCISSVLESTVRTFFFWGGVRKIFS